MVDWIVDGQGIHYHMLSLKTSRSWRRWTFLHGVTDHGNYYCIYETLWKVVKSPFSPHLMSLLVLQNNPKSWVWIMRYFLGGWCDEDLWYFRRNENLYDVFYLLPSLHRLIGLWRREVQQILSTFSFLLLCSFSIVLDTMAVTFGS